MKAEKTNLKCSDVFKPDDWVVSSLPKGFFDRPWLKKINLNDPKVKRNIMVAIIGAISVLGVISRRDVRKEVNNVLQSYRKRNKEIETSTSNTKKTHGTLKI